MTIGSMVTLTTTSSHPNDQQGFQKCQVNYSQHQQPSRLIAAAIILLFGLVYSAAAVEQHLLPTVAALVVLPGGCLQAPQSLSTQLEVGLVGCRSLQV